jgi:hypothetical protein
LTAPKIDIVFDGPPGPESGRFVEVEDAEGRSINLGDWEPLAKGLFALRIDDPRHIEVLERRLEKATDEVQELLRTLSRVAEWDSKAKAWTERQTLPISTRPDGARVVHNVKTWLRFFDDVNRGWKRFEVRKNDRDYRAGDFLVLEEFNPETDSFTGRELPAMIIYKIEGGQFGIAKDYCVLGIELRR